MDPEVVVIRDNLLRIKEAMAAAARASGRSSTAIRLIAVSKTKPATAVLAALRTGHTAFGENTVQEALGKITALNAHAIEWHLIGHLQSNKARHVPGHFGWLHSLDNLALSAKLDAGGQPLNVLIQVNAAEDPRKHGVSPPALPAFVESLLAAGHRNLRLRGLMTIGVAGADEAASRDTFARLRALAEMCRQQFHLLDFTELSMGMSHDYRWAIAEGATMVRIGSAIFGERHYD